MNPITVVIISAASDFVISAGGVLVGGGVATGATTQSVQIPGLGVWVAAGIWGAMAFAKEVKQNLQGAKDEHKANQA